MTTSLTTIGTNTTLTVTETTQTLVSSGTSTVIDSGSGAIGPSGPPGSGGAASYTVTASEPIGGQRVVTINGFHATPETSDLIIGLSKSAAATSQSFEVTVFGLVADVSWTWTTGLPIFVGPSGTLTQTVPTLGVSRRIAWAVSPTTINVDIMPPITVI